MSAPERIWLQDAGDYDNTAQFEVTWCAEPQDDADTEYIRADLVQTLVEASKGLLFAHDHGNGLEGWHNTRERMRAALRAIGEGGE